MFNGLIGGRCNYSLAEVSWGYVGCVGSVHRPSTLIQSKNCSCHTHLRIVHILANCPRMSGVYRSCPLSHMQDAIYIECPGIFVVIPAYCHNRDAKSGIIIWCDVVLV